MIEVRGVGKLPIGDDPWKGAICGDGGDTIFRGVRPRVVTALWGVETQGDEGAHTSSGLGVEGENGGPGRDGDDVPKGDGGNQFPIRMVHRIANY